MTLVACGEETSDGGGSGGGSSASTAVATSASTTAATGTLHPEAPVLDTVGALHGALHVFWTNVTTDCDAIEIERKTATVPYALLFSLAGDIEDQADDAATDPTVLYTYRLRCRRGSEVSPYSNEDGRMPHPEE